MLRGPSEMQRIDPWLVVYKVSALPVVLLLQPCASRFLCSYERKVGTFLLGVLMLKYDSDGRNTASGWVYDSMTCRVNPPHTSKIPHSSTVRPEPGS